MRPFSHFRLNPSQSRAVQCRLQSRVPYPDHARSLLPSPVHARSLLPYPVHARGLLPYPIHDHSLQSSLPYPYAHSLQSPLPYLYARSIQSPLPYPYAHGLQSSPSQLNHIRCNLLAFSRPRIGAISRTSTRIWNRS
jgi:hypothetical protein